MVDRSTSDVIAGVRAAYDVVAADYAAYFPDTTAEQPADLAMVDALAAAVGSELPLLDAGCGTGRVARYLRARGCQVEGVDLSPGMVAQARMATPDGRFTVGSLTALPYRHECFGGVMLWYSTIHTPPALQERIYREVRRVLRPGGHVLVGFQEGSGTRDVGPAYSQFGHDIVLERHLFTADDVAGWLRDVGIEETARHVRAARGDERDRQAAVLGRAG